jgi:hypothetical protein
MLLGGVAAAAAAAAVAQVATVDREERRDRMWLQLQQARATQAREAWADQEARRLREGERLAPTMISLTAIAAAPPTTDRRPLARLTSDAPLCDRDDPCAALRREQQRRELAEGERQRGHGRAQLTHHRSTVMPDGTRLPRGSCGAPSQGRSVMRASSRRRWWITSGSRRASMRASSASRWRPPRTRRDTHETVYSQN